MTRRIAIITTLLILCGTVHATDYYPASLNGLSGVQLKKALTALIAPHRRAPFDDAAYDIIARCDRLPDGRILSFLDPEPIDAAAVVLHRVIPGEWIGDYYPYRYDLSYDLHLLLPAGSAADEAIGEAPLGSVAYATFDNGATRVGSSYLLGIETLAWEPADDRKGDLARLMMYAATCYPDYPWQSLALNQIVGGDYPTFNRPSIELLLEWARADAVDEHERMRCEAIFELQGNRNPYVDFPDLMEYVWGEKTSDPFDGIDVPTPPDDPDDPDDPKPDDSPLKASYRLSDTSINLHSPFVPTDAQWSIDGVPVTASSVSPAELGIGKHLIEFQNSFTSGSVAIEITP